MYENNETTPEPQPVPREMLEARIQELTNELAQANTAKDSWYDSWKNLRADVDKAEEGFKEILAGDMDASDIIESYGAVMTEHLGWEFTRQAEVVITVTWRGTIELPFGTEVDELDIDDFGLNEPSHNEYSTWFDRIDDYSIEER
jgi:hypothetical protein